MDDDIKTRAKRKRRNRKKKRREEKRKTVARNDILSNNAVLKFYVQIRWIEIKTAQHEAAGFADNASRSCSRLLPAGPRGRDFFFLSTRAFPLECTSATKWIFRDGNEEREMAAQPFDRSKKTENQIPRSKNYVTIYMKCKNSGINCTNTIRCRQFHVKRKKKKINSKAESKQRNTCRRWSPFFRVYHFYWWTIMPSRARTRGPL